MKALMIAKQLCALVVLVSIFCSFTSLYAVEDQFEISLTVSGDVTAPSVPSGLSATAISSSQIDLSWTASTDNVSVLAYRVYRDSVFVATSSVTTYSDIGLSASTLYSYTVSAVDGSYNESAQSASASATTLSAPSSSGGGVVPPTISNVQVIPTLTGAFISWNTDQASQTQFSWGQTNDYEMGDSFGPVFKTSHHVNISGLNPATTYWFKITATNGYGVSRTLSNLTFSTSLLPSGKENVGGFIATARDSHIDLSWQNPNDLDFVEVRLVRKEGYFPADSSDGEVIYEGRLESFVDSNVDVGVRYYYAIFAKYSDDSLSSGSLASARIALSGETAEPFDPFDSIPKAEGVHPKIEALSLLDFEFIQGGRKIIFFGNETVSINGEENLTVSLNYEKVPEVLKTILITLSDPDNPEQTFSFLLRVNEEKTAYMATIGPLGKSGLYGVNIAIIDYKNRGLKKIVGNLLATVGIGFSDSRNTFSGSILFLKENWFNILPLLIILYCIYRILKKRKKKDVAESPKVIDEKVL